MPMPPNVIIDPVEMDVACVVLVMCNEPSMYASDMTHNPPEMSTAPVCDLFRLKTGDCGQFLLDLRPPPLLLERVHPHGTSKQSQYQQPKPYLRPSKKHRHFLCHTIPSRLSTTWYTQPLPAPTAAIFQRIAFGFCLPLSMQLPPLDLSACQT